MSEGPRSDTGDDSFEPYRPYLRGIAYRMLGSVSDADDIVQEAFLRWRAVDVNQIREPRAFLARVTTRLCLDQLGSARARREHYVGTWLPEPIAEALSEKGAVSSPAELAADLSVALLMTLERLSPLERAAFLLHDVFDFEFSAIADTLDRSEQACRQLALRAREHVRANRPRFEAERGARERLAQAFHQVMLNGDVAALAEMLADDAIMYTDGGGKRVAALNPIYGRDKILRFVVGVTRKRGLPQPSNVQRVELNGVPAFLMRTEDGDVEALLLEVHGERIASIYSVRNPDKLRHLRFTGSA